MRMNKKMKTMADKMANVLYNMAQSGVIPTDWQQSARTAYQDYDAAKGEQRDKEIAAKENKSPSKSKTRRSRISSALANDPIIVGHLRESVTNFKEGRTISGEEFIKRAKSKSKT